MRRSFSAQLDYLLFDKLFIIWIVLGLLVVFIFFHDDTSTVVLQSRPAKNDDCTINVYYAGDSETANATTLCVITKGDFSTTDDMQRLKKEACKCGADSIVIDSIVEKSASLRAILHEGP